MYFSPEVIAVQDDMNWGADNQANLYWGTDINFDKADVDAATRSLYVRYDDKGGDFTEEIAISLHWGTNVSQKWKVKGTQFPSGVWGSAPMQPLKEAL